MRCWFELFDGRIGWFVVYIKQVTVKIASFGGLVVCVDFGFSWCLMFASDLDVYVKFGCLG